MRIHKALCILSHRSLQGFLYLGGSSLPKAPALVFWAGLGWAGAASLASKRSPRKEAGQHKPVTLSREGTPKESAPAFDYSHLFFNVVINIKVLDFTSFLPYIFIVI